MSEIHGKSWIEISRDSLRDNFLILKKLASPAEVMCVVKANAYGHGLAEVGTILKDAGARWFAADSLHEGRFLRSRIGREQKILILGFVTHAGWGEALQNDLSIVLFNSEQLKSLEKALASTDAARIARLHLPIETGLYREGFERTELNAVIDEIVRIRGLFPDRIIVEGVQTHLANVEDTYDRTYADLQAERFERTQGVMLEHGFDSYLRHTASSAVSFLYTNLHFDFIRPGIALYGLWPSEKTRLTLERAGESQTLSPVLAWKSMVAQIKNVAKGEPVGYGLSECVGRDSKIAVIPVGYYDGYDRSLSGRGEVLIKGKRCKVVGRICMNMFMVDVTDAPDVVAEDEVVLIGEQGCERIKAEELAARAGTINYEIVSRLGGHLPRIVV